MAEKLILLRHGETEPGYQDRYIGHKDIPMAEAGHRRIESLMDMLRLNRPDICVSSTLLRCSQTAEIIKANLNLPVHFNPDLKEVNFGDWEGLSFWEITALWPEQVTQWARFDADFTFPGGESFIDFLTRVDRVAKTLTAAPEETILVCTHGGMIRSLICHFLRLQPQDYILFKIKPASLTTIELSGGNGILSGLNETVYS